MLLPSSIVAYGSLSSRTLFVYRDVDQFVANYYCRPVQSILVSNQFSLFLIVDSVSILKWSGHTEELIRLLLIKVLIDY